MNIHSTMENSSIDLTHQHHQYHAHHPTQLPDQSLALNISSETVVLLNEINPNCNSSDNIPTTKPALGVQLDIPTGENEQDHPATIEFESPDSQNEQPERCEIAVLSIQDENQNIDPTLTGFESPDGQNEQPERGEIAVSIRDENQSIDLMLTGTHGCSDPKGVSYLLRMYSIFMGLVAGKSLWEKHTPFPITNPFMITSIVAYAMAYMNLLILSCIYDGLPRRTFSPTHYKISKYVFHILCFLAHFLLLPLLFNPSD